MLALLTNNWIAIAMITLVSMPASASPAKLKAAPDVRLHSALTVSPNETRGKALFDLRCARCHQADARGSAQNQIPSLAGQQYEYLVKQLVDFKDSERRNATMHKILSQNDVNDAQSIADVVGYVANLPMNPAPGKGPGTALSLGKQLFNSACVSCHGQTAEGNADLWIPNLRGQHYSYLLKQMKMMADKRRDNISEDLHRTFRNYAPQELEAVADYLTRMTP